MALVAGTVRAEERIALVVGNSQYGSVSPLDNPARDARLMGETLAGLGFEVTLLIDTSQAEMKQGIARFGSALRQAGTDATGLFYYAGHGVQSYGTNYLLPVDIALSDPADLDLVAVEAQSVLRQMFSARNKTNIVILDACRNNPFTDIPDFNDNGLAEMQAPTGTFLAYATAPGDVAYDGLEDNSPFTRAMAEQIRQPGVPIEQVFKQVRVAVLEKTGGLQTPWDASSLTDDFMFAQATPKSAADLEAEQVWNSVRASRDPVQIMLFLRGYPDSPFTADARELLTELMAQELAGTAPAAPAAPPSAPSAAEQKMFEAAQADATPAAYETYLAAYPDGVFAEIARQELVALRQNSGHDPVGGGTTETAAAAPEPAAPAPAAAEGPVSFDSPLTSELPEISGRTIAELITASPLFPPVENLPEAYWKGQTCSNCHEWNAERLCQQANVYLSLNMQRSLDKQHPFGGAFKRHLRNWAAGGCR